MKYSFKKEIVQKQYRKRLRIINSMLSGQKEKKKYTKSIPCCKEIGYILKYEVAKYNVHFNLEQFFNHNFIQRERN